MARGVSEVAAERAAAEERRRNEEYRQERLHNDRVELMKDPAFLRVMGDILEDGLLFHSVMTGNAQTYHNSGRQDFARQIWGKLVAANRDRALDLLKPKFFDGEDDRNG